MRNSLWSRQSGSRRIFEQAEELGGGHPRFAELAARIQRVAVALGPVAKIRVADDVAFALTNTPSSKRQLPLLFWVDFALD
jgi:hypothetical protein